MSNHNKKFRVIRMANGLLRFEYGKKKKCPGHIPCLKRDVKDAFNVRVDHRAPKDEKIQAYVQARGL